MKTILIVAAALTSFTLFASGDIAGDNTENVFSAIQTQSSFYRGKSDFQPLIGLKVEKLRFNTFWRLSIELPEDVDPAMIADFKLYKSSVPYFAFSQATELWSGLTKTRNGRTFKLSFQPSGSYPTIAIDLNAPFVNGSVSVLGACALSGPWTRVATVFEPTERVFEIDKQRLLDYTFFKIVIEEGRQTLGPLQ